MVQLRGTWSGTVTLQRSTAGPDLGFSDVKSWSANVEEWFDDHMDNSIIWYRLGIKAGEYGSGTVLFLIAYPFGGGPGVVRVRNLESDTSAIIEVLETLAARDGTDDWQEGEWSNKYAYPSAVTLYEGRLFWLGKDRIWGSISDAYESFDIDLKGDAGPINRSIGYGPVEVINWGLPLQRLILGMQASEAAVRSTTFDQPLSPTNFSIKDISTQGSARVAAVKVDTRGVFVQASLRRIYQLVFNIEEADYNATDLTALLPDLDSNFTQLVVQRQPDTRIHCLRADGTVLLLTYEAKEEVLCWTKTETNGIVERMAVLPGDAEDKVYYYIARTVGGSTVRFVERFALITECQGGTLSKQLDSHVVISQSSSTTITGLSRLEGETVAVWANGKDLGLHTVASGAVTVSEAVTSAIVGLTYTATFKSAKLAYGSAAGTSLTQRKRIDHLGLILHNTHAQGLEAGQDFDTMDNLPLMYQGAAVDTNRVYDEFDEPMIILPGKWNTDARLCLRATAPRPVTLLGAVISVAANDTA
jgi:hypothetical protein